MRLSVILGFAACFLLPIQSQAAWDIFQSYVILDSGSGDQYLAGGINADGATAFNGTDLGDFTASDALTLNGGELKTYKNGGSNVCGGTLNYRVYASGDTPGAFTALALPYDSELGGGDQKWTATAAGVDLLGALSAGDYVLELYWEATGDDAGGCSDTKFDSNFGNNFTATFSIVVPGCTNPAYTEYDASATIDDGSCATLASSCSDVAMDGYTYSVVEIGDQCWFAENLRTTVYADGSPIPQVAEIGTWSGLSTGARCDYDNDASNVATYGRLYNWYAAKDCSGLCPSGWHVPTDGEFMVLEAHLGMPESELDTWAMRGGAQNVAGQLKASGEEFWQSDNGGQNTNSSGFTALGAGLRADFVSASGYSHLSITGYFWSASPTPWEGNSIFRSVYHNGTEVTRSGFPVETGFSVRCLKGAGVLGCTDPGYLEYNAEATVDDCSCATLVDPCAGALVLGSIEVDLSTTTVTAEDGSATLTVTTGTPTSLTLSGINGAPDYTIAQPGAIEGIAAGYYEVAAIDADGCNSDSLKLVMPYSLCCDCGVSDIDSDGLCDDEDNCTDKSASNYADPANGPCDN